MDIQHPILAIDHGEARFGIAVTDPTGILAHPLETIHCHQTPPIPRIIELLAQTHATAIIIGLPIRMDGTEGSAAAKIRNFAAELEEHTDIPIYYQDERLTTVAAAAKLHQAGKNAKKQKAIIDQAAAVEILNDWLEANAPIDFPPPLDCDDLGSHPFLD